MGWHGLSVHGTSVVAEAPGNLEHAGGLAWSDVVGYRRGWGNTFRGRANTFNWFHFAVPTLNLEDHASADLAEVRVNFLVNDPARVQSVHIWDAHVRLQAFDNLNLRGDFRTQVAPNQNSWLFQPALNMNGGLGISVGVQFRNPASDVLFTTAYARFTAP
jgi:hypothetical protein